MTPIATKAKSRGIAKCPTGINGLDEVLNGGLPRGRTTLVCGPAGSGKTLLAAEFIVRGIRDYGEPGVFMAFEETVEDLAKNVASLGFDIPTLIARKKMDVDHVHIERREIEETGEYDLEGLFVRLGSMIDGVKARRVAIDTLEALFGGLSNTGILRAELRRLFRWLKDRGVTTVVTGEQGERSLTRHGLEEYVSDCVIFLDHRLDNQIATRRLRVVKYRGSPHGTNEYPTLIDEKGLSVLPLSSVGLAYGVSRERVSTGIGRLDAMLGGGCYKGSSILVSGTAGSGKTSVAAAFADSVCRAGGRCLYFAFEESPDQILRNMLSIGLDLAPWVRRGALRFQAARPTLYGLESHLVSIQKQIEACEPDAVVIDPISNLTDVGQRSDVKAMLLRAVDFMKSRHITSLFTSLTLGDEETLEGREGVSSLMDTWILLRMVESRGERNRILFLLKSRGMAHSNQLREFRLTDRGVVLQDVYVGPSEVYTGSARLIQEAKDAAANAERGRSAARRQQELAVEQSQLRAQVEALQERLRGVAEEIQLSRTQERDLAELTTRERALMASTRGADNSDLKRMKAEG
jgi:circadian clock protein KaiC